MPTALGVAPRRRSLTFGWLVAATTLGACGAPPPRFALRPPITRDSDDRPLPRAPRMDDESDAANAVDATVLGPLSRGFAFRSSGEAHDVNSLDEVPDSTWFTNRTVRPEQLERGSCPDAGPTLPFTIKSSMLGGTTAGFVVKDARKQAYVIKLDSVAPFEPEISTAADAIVSRLYWAVGFNAPCNDVVYLEPGDLRLASGSYEKLPTGETAPLTAARLAQVFTRATRGADGRMRFSASRFIDGEPLGNWRAEGTRADDANDVIAHEDRRELRGEYFLAAWADHWDSRGPNSFDSFVRPPGARGGHVVHYFLDFSDSLGAISLPMAFRENRKGFVSVSNVPVMLEDLFTLGLLRHPWDDVQPDPRFPNLGHYDVAHFDALGFSALTPLVRWIRAERADRGWMARKIARLGVAHLRVAVRAGRLSHAAEEARLVDVLAGRRDKILRASFDECSPLADLAIEGDRLCATDLGLATKLSRPDDVAYGPAAERTGDRVCVGLPHGSAYAVVRVVRTELGRTTVLRAHVYELGPGRHFLAGIERL